MTLGRGLRFAIVGAIGFLVDAGVLMLLIGAFGPYWGRLVSFLCAVVTTWLCNRRFTFGDRPRTAPLHIEFGKYLGSMIVGGALNYGSYALLVHSGLWPLVALGIGSLLGLSVNLLLANHLVFGERR